MDNNKITWKNDPITNKKRKVTNYSRDEFFNIFEVFQKKYDFIKSKSNNQILQKTPYCGGVNLSNYVLKSIKKHGFKKITDYYLTYLIKEEAYKSKLLYHMKKILNLWIKKSYFPLPFIRVIILLNNEDQKNELKKILFKIEYITDYQMRQKFYYPKSPLEVLDKFLIYLIGIVFGDGAIDKEDFIAIYDGHRNRRKNKESKLFLEKINKSATEFGLKGSVRKHKRINMYGLQFTNKWFVRYFTFISGLPSGKKENLTVPPFIKKYKEYEKYFWRGLLDTDGSINFKPNSVNISSCCKMFMLEFTNFLRINNIGYRTYKLENKKGIWYQVQILAPEIGKFSELVGSSHPRKQKTLSKILKQRSFTIGCFGLNKNLLTKEGFFDHKLIKSIERKKIKLPKRPTKDLLYIARFVRPKAYAIRLYRKDKEVILNNKQLNYLASRVERFFNIKRKTEKKNFIFYSYTLSKFFSTFFLYKRRDPHKDTNKLIYKWNSIWD